MTAVAVSSSKDRGGILARYFYDDVDLTAATDIILAKQLLPVVCQVRVTLLSTTTIVGGTAMEFLINTYVDSDHSDFTADVIQKQLVPPSGTAVDSLAMPAGTVDDYYNVVETKSFGMPRFEIWGMDYIEPRITHTAPATAGEVSIILDVLDLTQRYL